MSNIHEQMMNQLTVVRGCAQTLLAKDLQLGDEVQRKLLQAIEQASWSLEHLMTRRA